MELLPDHPTDHIAIEAYEPGQVTINDKIYHECLVIQPQNVHPLSGCQRFSELTAATLDDIMSERKIDVLLIGTGAEPELPPAWLQQYAIEHQIGLEVMTSEPACRTFNILASDGRACLCLLFV